MSALQKAVNVFQMIPVMTWHTFWQRTPTEMNCSKILRPSDQTKSNLLSPQAFDAMALANYIIKEQA